MKLFIVLVSSFIFSFSASAAEPFKLQILHTNDMHARFEEVNEYGGSCSSNEECFGGFARIKQAVTDKKNEARRAGIPSIFLNAGDTFQGSAYYTFFKWRIVASLIDTLGIDVMVRKFGPLSNEYYGD